MTRAESRRGFNLIELMVVIAILGVIGALLLAAVQKARTTAARLGCASNLRQVGLALHHYEGAHSSLPPGVSHPVLLPGLPQVYGPDTDPYPLLNWQARLLPFIEQDALWRATHEAYSQDRYWIDSPPHVGLTTPVALFICPADGPRPRPSENTLAVTNYLGVSGTNGYRGDGVLYLDSLVRLTDILDGTSMTLMVGERPPSANHLYGRWYGGWGPWGTANAYLGVRETQVDDPRLCPDAPYPYTHDRLENDCASFHFWSRHPGGAHFLFADGSVRFMSYPSDAVLPALATRAKGEIATLPP